MRHLLTAALLLCWAAPLAAQDDPAITPLYRFWDAQKEEHVYSYGEGEPGDWRKNPTRFQDETIIGLGSTEEKPGTVRLWRAVRRDGKHYFYIVGDPKIMEDSKIEAFVMYVWRKPGSGRVAVHACAMPDGLDPFFDPDFEAVKKLTKETATSKGVKRVVVRNSFYLMEAPAEE